MYFDSIHITNVEIDVSLPSNNINCIKKPSHLIRRRLTEYDEKTIITLPRGRIYKNRYVWGGEPAGLS